MLTIITGVPGSGKTAAAVDLILSEYKGRMLYVDGLNGLKLEHVPIDVMEWHQEAPDGALIVVDEVQRKWRPRGPGSKVPDSVAALETHRHRGIDMVLITQNPRLLDSNVRALIGRHVHIRDTGFMGRWAYEWPECNVNLAWQNCQNKRRYKLPKHVFDLYTSASLHTKPVRKIPPLVYFVAVLLLLLAGVLWNLYIKGVKPEAPALAVAPAAAGVTAKMGGSASPSAPAFIDDRVAFVPRISNKPETAPAYDEVRKVVNMPLVSGGMCMAGECRCVTQQGTDAGLTAAECRAWMDRRPFDPYTVQQQPSAVASRGGIASVSTSSEPGRTGFVRGESVNVVPMPSGVSNPRADARPVSPLPPGSPVHPEQSTDGRLPIAPPSLLSPYRRT